MNSAAKAGIGSAAVVAAVVLFIVLSGGDDSDSGDSSPTTTTEASQPGGGGGGGDGGTEKLQVATIVVKDGEPVGGIEELSFSAGDDIQFAVESDSDQEVHFHGYDIAKDVKAGDEVTFNVPATIEGVFEVEIEETATQIAEITVNPG